MQAILTRLLSVLLLFSAVPHSSAARAVATVPATERAVQIKDINAGPEISLNTRLSLG